MSNLIKKEMSYFFSSAEALGAINKDRNGSRFQIAMQNIANVPPSAVDVTLEVTSANIWHTSPNISAEDWQNDKMYLVHNPYLLPNTIQILPDPNDYLIVLTMPKGLYGISELNDTISELIQNVTLPNTSERLTSDSVILTADAATQRVKLQLGPHLRLIIESLPAFPNNIASTLGYTANAVGALGIQGDQHKSTALRVGPPEYVGQKFTADRVASLNKINSFLLHGDILRGGITVNGRRANIMTEVQITAKPGKLINFRPFNPYKLDGSHLKHGVNDLLTFWLTNELNQPIDTFGEDYTFSVTISYMVDPSQVMTGIRPPSVHSQAS
jgi:hypothetical protein